MSDLGFDEMAEFYRYRTPYNKNIFPGIAKELGFDPSTIILDLACGDGPLSVGISSYVGRVIAVDSSSVMLTRARKAGNVEYRQNDLAKDGVWTHPGKVEAPYTVCIASASNLTGLVKSRVECRRTGL